MWVNGAETKAQTAREASHFSHLIVIHALIVIPTKAPVNEPTLSDYKALVKN